MLVLAYVYGLVGLVLVLVPDQVSAFWPWTLTPLTGRVIGGWLLTVATLAWMAARQRTVKKLGLFSSP
jgi:hypothetical protein